MQRRLRLRRVKAKANEILRTVYGEQPTAPIDLSLLFFRHNIYLQRAPLETLDGLLYYHCGKCIMIVNSNHHPLRQRFSQAHEWGHFFLHPGVKLQLSVGHPTHYDRQANRFAEELLMPEIPFRRLYERLTIADPHHVVRHLSRMFTVSRPAVRVRIERLGLI